MKNALISPNESPIKYISDWTKTVPPDPIYTAIPNSCRIAEVSNQTFEVAPPLFWTECEDDISADEWYYNIQTNKILKTPKEVVASPDLILNVTETIS